MQNISGEATQQERSSWMGVLARSRRQDIEDFWTEHGDYFAVEWLRKPHTGLVMVRGRAGGTGNPFNLGEMTVTRCAVRLANGIVGHGYVQGRDRRHAEFAAILDALLQQSDCRKDLLVRVIEPLRARQAELRVEGSRKAASTKVEFFTLVRGENAV
ncbi:hypothetical protein GCM10010869_05280 [Mesorhizobium tianshanense]|uniref:Alpha-D-ribose 1-methylphosphonate 5-triphosphate synthase subunit PhnG n=1 Tax=Mesorhizobium tianshanense TaxID=39844 RepID=A0A562NLV3_9HYPH|nr:phosphonate C-P lyase system protein PhnG [Mesorhizobium tianshanense]TWI33187.1 alpha-D-ribose 1-methylphosphonate 5-triphosphate synthase subunit PhnG [Mesorhizobium tianshanense]GLS34940.1 hypothetical protein GCM10010869_05280 [Mesorhizobium tianshanense]